jgi:hypothetical protein
MENGHQQKIALFLRFIAVLGLAVLVLIGIHRFSYFKSYPAPSATDSNPLLSSQMESGDLIFRQGKGLWSPYFAGVNSRTGFSHLGVLMNEGSEFYVLHADAEDLTLKGGAQKTALSSFIEDALHVEIRRNLMPQEAKDEFLWQLDTMVRNGILFDDRFDLEDEGSRVYCTEFVWIAAQRAGILDFGEVIRLAGREVVLVDSFFTSRWLSH